MASPPCPLALIRHPQPAIAAGLCYGRLDIGLTPAGHAAITPIIAQLAGHPASIILTSPAQRCRILAEALGAARDIPVETDPRLQELDFGAWEGVAWNDVPRAALDAWAASPETFAPPGGESGAALLARVTAAYHDCLIRARPAIIVSHGGPLRLLIALANGTRPDLLTPAPPLGSITLIADPARSMPAG